MMGVNDGWNVSLLGDYVWTSGNAVEAIPDAMTPATQSAWELAAREAIGPQFVAGHPLWGAIAGRFYFNLSMTLSLARRFRSTAIIRELTEQSVGVVPADVEVPLVDLPFWQAWRRAGARETRMQTEALVRRRAITRRAGAIPARCEAVHDHLDHVDTTAALRLLWDEEVSALVTDGLALMRYARPAAMRMALAHRVLRRFLGDERANLVTGAGDSLASLDLLLGLEQLADGTIDDDTFRSRFGHRGPHEYELSHPRPGEDRHWVAAQLAWLRDNRTSVRSRLDEQAERRATAWTAIESERWHRIAHRVAHTWTEAAEQRELLRSESVRTLWVLRHFLTKAADLTDAGDAIWYLQLDEVRRLLDGDDSPLHAVPARRARHEHHAALPHYPTLIRGAFDPDATTAPPTPSQQDDDVITGFPGAAGILTGTARVILDLDDSTELQHGEILVTPFTNVGWTPTLLHAAAVITDIGAPLSHAAIVARELGIPAVVGCRNATTRIHTGERIHIDGAAGTIHRLTSDPLD